MDRQAGSITGGLAITLAIIFFALMVGCIAIAHSSNHSHSMQQPFYHQRNRCEEQDDCYNEDNRSDYGSHGDNSAHRNRGSFSPGPFDRSPVDIHDNQVCISPDCSSHNDGDSKNKKETQPSPRYVVMTPTLRAV